MHKSYSTLHASCSMRRHFNNDDNNAVGLVDDCAKSIIDVWFSCSQNTFATGACSDYKRLITRKNLWIRGIYSIRNNVMFQTLMKVEFLGNFKSKVSTTSCNDIIEIYQM